MARAYIGTSGWQYSHWRGSFYPENLAQRNWLDYYSKYFNTVEINSTFYRQTKASTFQKWQEETPSDFVFAIKGNRFITHIKRLKDCYESLEIFFNSLGGLTSLEVRPHKGKHVVLWQLPPSLRQDTERLGRFLGILKTFDRPSLTWRHAFEFRHPSWVNDQTWEVLKKYNSAVVFQDWPDWPQIREITADFVYLRFHGNKELYSSDYKYEELKVLASDIKQWLRQDKDVYAYFNNDALGYAVPNARRLQELVGK